MIPLNPKGNDESNNPAGLIAVIFFFAIIAFIVQDCHKKSVRRGDYRYTIAWVVKHCGKGGYDREIHYRVGDEEYVDCSNDNQIRLGDTLFVKYYINDNSEYDLTHKKVRSGIKPPKYGWLEIPQ